MPLDHEDPLSYLRKNMTQASLTQLFPPGFLSDSDIHKSLGEEFSLCDSGNMIFHWSDFGETCDIVQEHIKNDPELKEDFRRREESIARLHLIPVWVKSGRKVYQKTMFELYERHILNLQHQMGGIDPYETIEISFLSGSGPFKALSIAECFNKITYQDFILIYLLKGKLPRRNFRLRLKSKVLVEYGEDFAKARLVNLEQMTSEGLLFSFESEFYKSELVSEKTVRFLIDTLVLKDSIGMPVAKLQSHLSHHTFNLMYSSKKEDAMEYPIEHAHTSSSFDHLKNKKVYIFAPYEVLAKNQPDKAKTMKTFVDFSRELVREHYRILTDKIKTA